MKRVIVLAVCLLAAVLGWSDAAATCQAGVFPIFQCGFVGWFAPPPPGAGTVSAVWWQVGYGNNNLNNGLVGTAAQDGTGMITGAFPGNDSGVSTPMTTNTGPFGLKPAQSVLGHIYPGVIPAGSLCADYENSWGAAGVDGCPDNPRTTNAVDNDDLLNPYWSTTYGPCYAGGYATTSQLIDYPMAVLARESTNRYFSLAFLSNHSRNGDCNDSSEGLFNLAAVSNGDPNPVPGRGNNVIPWQAVPKPLITSIVPGLGAGPGPRQVSLQWTNIRMVHDGSAKQANGRPDVPPGGGVGVLDHLAQPGGLCRFQLQTAPAPTATPDPATLPWSNAGSPIPCGGLNQVVASLTVDLGTAIRVRTILGKQPRTTATSLANCRLGSCGDLGFEATDCRADNCVNSPPLIVLPSALASEKIVDAAAVKDKGGIRLTFRTTAELSVDSIDVLGKGGAVIRSIPCKQCTTGIGDSYDVLLDRGSLKGAKSIALRLNGPGSLTEPIPVP